MIFELDDGRTDQHPKDAAHARGQALRFDHLDRAHDRQGADVLRHDFAERNPIVDTDAGGNE